MHKLVLFDVDQTLISTGGVDSQSIIAAIEKTSGISGKEIKETGISFAGKTHPQIIEEIFLACQYYNNENNLRYQEIVRAIDLYLQLLPQAIANSEKYLVHEGVNEILTLLKEDRRIALGLLTGNMEKAARLKLEPGNLNHFFPIGSFGSDSASRLDLPAIAHQRAQIFYKTQFRADQIVIIGDAENDVLCAKHYGAISLTVTTGSTTSEQLRKYNPHYIFPSLKNTRQIMRAILAEDPPNVLEREKIRS